MATTMISNRHIEDNIALQAALELSMQNLNNTTYSTMANSDSPYGLFEYDEPSSPQLELNAKAKSQNITKCVAVPSSEHVAEIVGRQGCKIKALRAKTNTYIKTPVRGEQPIFIITGRPEDVSAAKREILGAADHFAQIRATRRTSATSSPCNMSSPSISEDNKVTIYVRVPYRVVGLVVGPKGATVKRIQQNTQTYIVTPSRDKEPCFEVKGIPENVERARKEIESYIALRTGGSCDNSPDSISLGDSDYSGLMSPGSADTFFSPTSSTTALNHFPQQQQNMHHHQQQQQHRRMSESTKSFFYGSMVRPSGPMEVNGAPFGIGPVDSSNTSSNVMNVGSGWGVINNRRSSPLSSAVFSGGVSDQPQAPNGYLPMSAPAMGSERVFDFSSFTNASPQSMMKHQPPSPTGSCESNASEGTAAMSPKQSPRLGCGARNNCCMCHESEVSATLIPCGHNLFCQQCAHQIAYSSRRCPVCLTQVANVLRRK